MRKILLTSVGVAILQVPTQPTLLFLVQQKLRLWMMVTHLLIATILAYQRLLITEWFYLFKQQHG